MHENLGTRLVCNVLIGSWLYSRWHSIYPSLYCRPNAPINGMPHLTYWGQMLEKGGGGLPLKSSPRGGYLVEIVPSKHPYLPVTHPTPGDLLLSLSPAFVGCMHSTCTAHAVCRGGAWVQPYLDLDQWGSMQVQVTICSPTHI